MVQLGATTPDGVLRDLDGEPIVLDKGVLVITSQEFLSLLRQMVDGIERVQQQLAKINEGENLAPEERHYG